MRCDEGVASLARASQREHPPFQHVRRKITTRREEGDGRIQLKRLIPLARMGQHGCHAVSRHPGLACDELNRRDRLSQRLCARGAAQLPLPVRTRLRRGFVNVGQILFLCFVPSRAIFTAALLARLVSLVLFFIPLCILFNRVEGRLEAQRRA